MFIARLIVVVMFLATPRLFAGGRSGEPRIDLRVAYDQTSFELKITPTEFSYVEGPLRLAGRVRACNRALYQRLVRSYRAQREPTNAHLRPEFDVTVADGSDPRPIPRGGRLGTWLRQIPARITYLYVEAEVACHR